MAETLIVNTLSEGMNGIYPLLLMLLFLLFSFFCAVSVLIIFKKAPNKN